MPSLASTAWTWSLQLVRSRTTLTGHAEAPDYADVRPEGLRGERGAAFLAAFARAADVRAGAEVHVGAAAHAGDREQPDQRFEGRRSQRVAQRAGGSHQGGDVGAVIDVGRGAAGLGWQQVRGRHLGGRVHRLQVPDEAAHHAQPLRRPHRARAPWLCGPSDGQIGSACAHPDCFAKAAKSGRSRPSFPA
jgi:hypothetical protein